MHWSFSSTLYKEGERVDRLGMGPAHRTKTWKAVLDALNPSDIIAGTVIAMGSFLGRTMSRYGKKGQPQREKLTDDNVGLEPLNNRQRMRGYSGGSEFDERESLSRETSYEGSKYTPAMPAAARDTSPPDRARTFRADNLRPAYGGQEYQPLTRSRDPSPSGQHYPRQMV
jgi:hypothetical protein